jgi:hypothetical protein
MARATAKLPPAAAPANGLRTIIPGPPPPRAPTAKIPTKSRPNPNPPDLTNQESNPALIQHTVTAANIERNES